MYTAAGVWWRKFIRYQQRSASCQVYNVAFTVHSVAAEAAVEAAAVQATAYLVHHPSFDHHRCHIISTHNALITCLVKMFTTTEGSWYSNSNTYNHNNIMFDRRQGDHSRDNVKFHDIYLTVPGTSAHVKCYSYHAGTSIIVSGGGRNATVYDPKPKWNAQARQSQEWTQAL